MDQPTMGAEDFSFMLNERPGNYIMLGAAKARATIRWSTTLPTTSTTPC